MKKSKLVSACWPSSPASLPFLRYSSPLGFGGHIRRLCAAVLEPVEGCCLLAPGHWARLSEHFQLLKSTEQCWWWGWEGLGQVQAQALLSELGHW